MRSFAAGLLAQGVQPEQRVLLVMQDTVDLPVALLGAMFAGVIPVPANTLLHTADYAYMIDHSHARMVIASASRTQGSSAALAMTILARLWSIM